MATHPTQYSSAQEALAHKVRRVPDFPSEGVLFEDLTPVLADPAALHAVIREMAKTSART